MNHPSDNQETAAERYLVLMRHAKSDWGDPSLADHDRPLNRRGKRDSPRMAQWLAETGFMPDVVLSSSSTRTRETIGLMIEQWGAEPTVSFSKELYLATPDTILECIRAEAVEAQCLMVLAHNPSISYLASLLSGDSIEMPTAAVAVFKVEVDQWHDMRESTPIELTEYMRPKAL